ncbi:hypothetical protein T484DRAFT_1804861 [Baffinella frigidus]|nr:hypothetical protein T484DRAFT_1804861 [Cryptophyta sp. CCMP2293]
MADSISRVRTSVADNESGPTAVVKELAKFPFLVETQSGPTAVVKELAKFSFLVETQIDSYVEAWRESVHPIKETRAEIKRFVRAAEQETRAEIKRFVKIAE